jgi:hypothetical protein
VGIDRHRMADIRDAKAAQVLAAPPPDADRHTRHLVALHRRLDPLIKLTEQRVGRLVSRDRRVRRALRMRQP